jgi:hypothetical protein
MTLSLKAAILQDDHWVDQSGRLKAETVAVSSDAVVLLRIWIEIVRGLLSNQSLSEKLTRTVFVFLVRLKAHSR